MSNTALPRFGDLQMQDLINRLEIALNALEAAPLAEAVILPPVLISTSDTRVFHGLGRVLRYYWIVSTNADVRLATGGVPESIDPRNYFTLRASANATVTLAVA